MRTELRYDRVDHDVGVWRYERLVDSGFPAILADRLGQDPRYDLHALIELVERGCPPDLAVRILAPIDQDDTA